MSFVHIINQLQHLKLPTIGYYFDIRSITENKLRKIQTESINALMKFPFQLHMLENIVLRPH